MKIWKISGILFLAAAAVFFGFHFFFGRDRAPQDTDQSDDAVNVAQEAVFYRELASKLETELSSLKQEQYAASKQYEARIAELEHLLAEGEAALPEQPSAVYTYTVSKEQITITGYLGGDTAISIPSAIDGLNVVAIGRDAFRGSGLEEIVIPNTDQYIDWFAFRESKRLERIAIPTSVTKIEYGAFDGCERITVYCEKGSYADQYARSFGMSVAN